jgi:NAD(P)-dependent dehydrogenase (short-subunit alcohol dehydrogenase family)
MRLKDKVVIVTAAGTHLGRAISIMFTWDEAKWITGTTLCVDGGICATR